MTKSKELDSLDEREKVVGHLWRNYSEMEKLF